MAFHLAYPLLYPDSHNHTLPISALADAPRGDIASPIILYTDSFSYPSFHHPYFLCSLDWSRLPVQTPGEIKWFFPVLCLETIIKNLVFPFSSLGGDLFAYDWVISSDDSCSLELLDYMEWATGKTCLGSFLSGKLVMVFYIRLYWNRKFFLSFTLHRFSGKQSTESERLILWL
jgi:hypothetical protein